MDIKTNAAAVAIKSGMIQPEIAASLEKLAERTVARGKHSKERGFDTDAFDKLAATTKYGALTAEQQMLFVTIYGELLVKAGEALGGIAGVAGQKTGPSPQQVAAAYEQIVKTVKEQRDHSRRYGPGDHLDPTAPGFRLEDHPDHMMRHAKRVKAFTTGDAHVLLTYTTQGLGEARTSFRVARSDVTPATMLAALRQVLGGKLADIEIRVQSDVDFLAGVPARSEAEIRASAPSPGIADATIAKIEGVRFSEMVYQAVHQTMLEAIAADPYLGAQLPSHKASDLATHILAAGRQGSVRELIDGFLKAWGIAVPPTAAADKPALRLGEAPEAARVEVLEARVEGDDLVAKVKYAGGFVDEHLLELYWNGGFLESLPPQAELVLVDRTADAGESLRVQDVRFSLAALRNAPGGGPIPINVNGKMLTYEP